MDSVMEQITALLGPMGPLLITGALGIVLIVAGGAALFFRPADPLDRLKNQRHGGFQAPGNAQSLRYDEGADTLDRFAEYLEPQNEAEYSTTRKLLFQAGYRAQSSVRMYHFARFALGMAALALATLYVMVAEIGSDPTIAALYIIGPTVVAYYAPRYWIDRRIDGRKQEITNGFPDSLDLMLVCVEAGQGLDQAIIRVAKEIRSGFPALADEYEIVSWEIKAGKDKATVLRDMGERCDVADVSSFVTVLIQSQTFGTSIAEALRVYAAEMRDKRVMRAEEKANVLPTKLTLGTMIFTVPPLLIILVGPSVYNIYEFLQQGIVQ